MPSTQLATLARHMEWADATIWQAVLNAPAAREDAAIRRTLHHLHLVQNIFADAWQGRRPAVRQEHEFASLDALATWAREGIDRARQCIDSLPPERLDEAFREPWTGQFEAAWKQGTAASHTLGESMLQAILHTAHHRGQICARLRALEVEPPTIDFIVWLWGGRPAAAWPAVQAPLAASDGVAR